MTTSEEATRSEIPDNLRRAGEEHSWPEELLQRAVDLRVPRRELNRWLNWGQDVEHIRRRIDWHERLTLGPLRGREATQDDIEAYADLFANSPEELGDWEIITERMPFAFAQFRLQENVTVLVIEDGGVLVASCAFSMRDTFVGGKRILVRYGQAMRVRREYRRQGYADQVRNLPWAIGSARPSHTQYDIMRSQNYAIVNWWKKYYSDVYEHTPEREGDIPGVSVSVLHCPRRPFEGSEHGIRKVRTADLSRCVGLINRTHRGLDLFRPYTVDFLRRRLDDGCFDDEAFGDWWPHVYGWQDYYVLEERGRVVACAGLWDRGRDMRDRWCHKDSKEEKKVSATGLMDFGYQPGKEAAMARLIGFLVGETDRLGRDYLIAPAERLPKLVTRLEAYEPIPETRGIRWGIAEPMISRPYIDLAYW